MPALSAPDNLTSRFGPTYLMTGTVAGKVRTSAHGPGKGSSALTCTLSPTTVGLSSFLRP